MLLLLSVLFLSTNDLGMTIFRRMSTIWASLNFIRSITVVSTILPEPSPLCREITPIGSVKSGIKYRRKF